MANDFVIFTHPAPYPSVDSTTHYAIGKGVARDVITDRGVITFTRGLYGSWYCHGRQNSRDFVYVSNILTMNGVDGGPLLNLATVRVERNRMDGTGKVDTVGFYRFDTERAAMSWATDVVLGLANPAEAPVALTVQPETTLH